jgi:hypothetical protein
MNPSSEPTKFLLLFYTSATNSGLFYNIFTGVLLWADDALVLLSERPEGRVSLYLSENILVWRYLFFGASARHVCCEPRICFECRYEKEDAIFERSGLLLGVMNS